MSIQDPPLPVGTVFRLGDRLEWNPYSAELKKNGLNPYFYDITLEAPCQGFTSQSLIVQAHGLEESIAEIGEPEEQRK